MQVLLGDFGDRDVVDIDVLLADEVEQQIERAVVHCADDDGERRIVRALVRVNMRSGRVGLGVRGVLGILGHGNKFIGAIGVLRLAANPRPLAQNDKSAVSYPRMLETYPLSTDNYPFLLCASVMKMLFVFACALRRQFVIV